MNIYLKWNKNKLSNESNIHLFDLEISQTENSFATARMVIDALTSLPPTGTEGFIVQENNEILFKGLLIGNPVKIEGAFGVIKLIAKPLDFLDKITVLQQANRVHPYWDGLWVRPDKHADFQEIQEVRTASLFCDPRTGILSLSDWFEGKKTIALHTKFFPQSLTVKIVQSPLQACTVNVHAHWIHQARGISNLGPQMRRVFPHGKMSTYTERALLEKWPEARKPLGRSGLWILKSELKPILPSSSLYPTYSPPISVGEGKIYRAKRYWFKPTLWVRWQARQKRKETLSLTLFHDFQPLFPGEGEHKTIEFTLQNINPDGDAYAWQPASFYREGAKVAYQNGVYMCQSDHTSGLSFEENQEMWSFKKLFHTPLGDPARDSFFLTGRGYQAAEHAMERAKVALAKSARCLEVSFEGSWDELKDVTTDNSLILSDPRLPGGEVKGKVVKHVLTAKGDTGERVVSITLLCAAGRGKEAVVKASPTPLYSIEGYGTDDYEAYENQVSHNPTGLSYFRYDTQSPIERARSAPLVRGIQLINGPKDQEAEMLKHTYPSPTALKKTMSQKPTHLRVFFKDLRTKERLEHRIEVSMAAPWSAPRQYSVVSS